METIERKLESTQAKLANMEKPKKDAIKDKKKVAEDHLYKLIPKHLAFGPYEDHLVQSDMNRIFQSLVRHTSFSRESFLLALGTGTFIPPLHAATSYCGAATGVEICPIRTLYGANLVSAYFDCLDDEMKRNTNVALINEDLTKIKSPNFASHIISFDLLFNEHTFESSIELVAKSTAKCFASFKIARFPTLLKYVKEALDAEEVDRLHGLNMASGGRSATAIILKRRNAPKVVRSGGGDDDDSLVDISKVVSKFICNDPKKTQEQFKMLANTCFESMEKNASQGRAAARKPASTL